MIAFDELCRLYARDEVRFAPAAAPVWIVPEDIEAQIRAVMSRHYWEETYRVARVLGDRNLATKLIGNQRSEFCNLLSKRHSL